jgi:hypothetical protein
MKLPGLSAWFVVKNLRGCSLPLYPSARRRVSRALKGAVASAGAFNLPLPLHFVQRGPYILLPGAGCLITGRKPVPLQAGHTSLATSDLIGFIKRAPPAMNHQSD